uniref:Phosphatidylserine synthase n=1 Tax=Macrostomum lignano TaxID=282301 RepID=A0A1I8FTQ6_9PLAT
MPNGPFNRPHPAVWRIVFGVSVLYFLVMVFVCFLSYEDARRALHFMYPDLHSMTIDDILDKDYAVNCSEVTVARLYAHLDGFAVAHLFGWVMKAVLLRHYGLAWLLSVNWEITELAFSHILPNFRECWWDIVLLDVLLCNGLGIYLGMQLCKWLEMRSYHWESIRSINSTTGKIKRAFFQFTPGSWTPTRWLDPESSFMRVIAVSILVVMTQLAELNCFFLKHIFLVRPSHPTTLGRLVLISAISAPAIRQYYLYVTDPLVNRVGTQLWVFVAVVVTEAIVCLKFGRHFFEKTVILNIVLWIVYSIMSSFFIVFLCAFVAKARCSRRSSAKTNGYSKHVLSDNQILHVLLRQAGRTLLSSRPTARPVTAVEATGPLPSSSRSCPSFQKSMTRSRTHSETYKPKGSQQLAAHPCASMTVILPKASFAMSAGYDPIAGHGAVRIAAKHFALLPLWSLLTANAQLRNIQVSNSTTFSPMLGDHLLLPAQAFADWGLRIMQPVLLQSQHCCSVLPCPGGAQPKPLGGNRVFPGHLPLTTCQRFCLDADSAASAAEQELQLSPISSTPIAAESAAVAIECETMPANRDLLLRILKYRLRSELSLSNSLAAQCSISSETASPRAPPQSPDTPSETPKRGRRTPRTGGAVAADAAASSGGGTGGLDLSDYRQLAVSLRPASDFRQPYRIVDATRLYFEPLDADPTAPVPAGSDDLPELFGLERQEEQLSAAVAQFVSELCSPTGFAFTGVFLCGPRGCGKASLAASVCRRLRCPLVRLDRNCLLGRYLGQAEANLSSTLKQAAASGSTCLLIEDIDEQFGEARAGSTGVDNRLRQVLASELEQLNSSGRLLLLATGSDLKSLNERLRSLFQLRILVPLPTGEAKARLMERQLNRLPEPMRPSDSGLVRQFAARVHGYSASELISLCKLAVHVSRTAGRQRLERRDFDEALRSFRPSGVQALLTSADRVSWDDIGGLDKLKQLLRDRVLAPLLEPDRFAKFGVRPPAGMLLYGPPGCCKTMMAKAVATECGLPFIAVQCADVYSRYVGDSERSIRELLTRAQAAAPAVLFLDEVDALLPTRGGGGPDAGGDSVGNRVLSEVLTLLDGVAGRSRLHKPAGVRGPALLRPGRLDRLIFVPLPDEASRQRILAVASARLPQCCEEDAAAAMSEVAARTEGLSGAELTALVSETAAESVQNGLTGLSWKLALQLLEAGRVRPRTSAAAMASYARFADSHGCGGF